MKRILSTLLLAGVGFAADPPSMKEGLWSIHMVSVDQPGNTKTDTTDKLCRSHAYDERVRAIAAQQSAKSSCKTISETTVGGTTTTENQCTVGKSVLKTKGVANINGDSAHSETHTTYTPPMYGATETTMVIDQKYLGACPAGVEPGDRIGADGQVRHAKQR
jgi:hypothetical protein